MPQNILLLSWRSSKSGGRKKIRSKRFFNLPFVVNVNYNYFQKKLFQQKLIRRMAMEMKKKKMSENATRDDLTEKEDQAQ